MSQNQTLTGSIFKNGDAQEMEFLPFLAKENILFYIPALIFISCVLIFINIAVMAEEHTSPSAGDSEVSADI